MIRKIVWMLFKCPKVKDRYLMREAYIESKDRELFEGGLVNEFT